MIKFVIRNPSKKKMDNFSFLNAAHSAYFADLYDQYLQNPDSLEPSWRAFFQGYDFGSKNNFIEEIVEGVTHQIPSYVCVFTNFMVSSLVNL